jgi:hypothetical protein
MSDPGMPALPQVTYVPPLSAVGGTDATLPVDESAAVGPPKIEGYQVLEKLGQGGMGTVWHAIQLGTRRKVALKLMSAAMFSSERARARFDREVELTARLDHPNIAAVYDSGVDRGIYFYAMERVDGVPLDLYVRSHRMTRRDVIELMRTISAAVHHAHQRGVIHRDLKPGNILIDADGQPHLVDFGLAKTILHEKADGDPAADAELAGTPAYMSPEQAAGNVDKLDTRTDVYSLGVILYRLLLGVSPHDLEGSQTQILQRITDTDPKRPRSIDKTIDKELELILLKAMARNPDDRYPSAGSFTRDLDNYLSGSPLLAHPATFLYLLGKYLVKYRLRVSIATGVVIVLVLMGVFSYVRVREKNEQLTYLIDFLNNLAHQPNSDGVFELILDNTMQRSHADAGSLFVCEGDVLRFEKARNLTFERREGPAAAAKHFSTFTVPISQQSIAGYAAATGDIVNLPDAYNLPPGVPYRFNPEFDRKNDYHSQSILAVPLKDPKGKIVGVLQLINRTDGDRVEPFPAGEVAMIQAMAEQAAIFLRRADLSGAEERQ